MKKLKMPKISIIIMLMAAITAAFSWYGITLVEDTMYQQFFWVNLIFGVLLFIAGAVELVYQTRKSKKNPVEKVKAQKLLPKEEIE